MTGARRRPRRSLAPWACEPRCRCADAFDWLVANGHSLAGLTGQDAPALKAIAHCWQLYASSREPAALEAIRALLDWSDRIHLWALVVPGEVRT